MREKTYKYIYNEKNNIICKYKEREKILYEYNESNLITNKSIYIENNLMKYVKYEYDSNNNIIKKETEKNIKIFEYNELNKIIKQLDISKGRIEFNKETIYEYDEKGNKLKKIDKNYINEYQYDKNNNLIHIIKMNKIQSETKEHIQVYEFVDFKYDENNFIIEEKLKSFLSGINLKIEYEYKNDYKEVYKTTIEENEYSLFNEIKKEVFIYDSHKDEKKLLKHYVDDQLVEENRYNNQGLLIYEFDLGMSIEYFYYYDEFNNLIKKEDLMDNEVVEYEYDSHNNIISEKSNHYIVNYKNEYKIEEKELFNYFDFNN